MKKGIVAIAMLVAGLMAGDALAQVGVSSTHWYRLSGGTSVFVGGPRTGLPATARAIVELDNQFGDVVDAAVVLFWRDGNARWFQVLEAGFGEAELLQVGPVGQHWYLRFGQIRENFNNADRDIYLGSGAAAWQLMGTAAGQPATPRGMRGIVASVSEDAMDVTGMGYGNASGMRYRVVQNDAINSALTALITELSNMGYNQAPDFMAASPLLFDGFVPVSPFGM